MNSCLTPQFVKHLQRFAFRKNDAESMTNTKCKQHNTYLTLYYSSKLPEPRNYHKLTFSTNFTLFSHMWRNLWTYPYKWSLCVTSQVSTRTFSILTLLRTRSQAFRTVPKFCFKTLCVYSKRFESNKTSEQFVQKSFFQYQKRFAWYMDFEFSIGTQGRAFLTKKTFDASTDEYETLLGHPDWIDQELLAFSLPEIICGFVLLAFL